MIAAALGTFFGCHLWHYFQIKHSPLLTSTGFNNKARSIWVKHIRENSLDIPAIQTMRNWTISAAFLASTAILLSLVSINSESDITAINQGVLYYNLGMRAYYLSIPLAFWLLGPVWMLICTLIVVFIIYKLDHRIKGVRKYEKTSTIFAFTKLICVDSNSRRHKLGRSRGKH